jgi:hypothetical protein
MKKAQNNLLKLKSNGKELRSNKSLEEDNQMIYKREKSLAPTSQSNSKISN